MKQNKRKPLLNRKETQTLLAAIKMTTAAGALSLTLGGWGLLAHFETRNIAQAATNQSVALVTSAPASATLISDPLPLQSAPVRQKSSLDIVRWVQDVSGNDVAVVRDRRGSLWYVMSSDVTRLEQGLSPRVRPQLVRRTTRTRASG